MVTLTATADAGSIFDGWDGACSGLGDCMVTMSAATAVAANFKLQPDLSLVKSVNPTSAEPGETVTYTLSFSNIGDLTASGVVITDVMPISMTVQSVTHSNNIVITRTNSVQTERFTSSDLPEW